VEETIIEMLVHVRNNLFPHEQNNGDNGDLPQSRNGRWNEQEMISKTLC